MNFFPLDCLAREVRPNVDVGTALTVLANGGYRRRGRRGRGFAKASPKQRYRRLVGAGGPVEVGEGRVVIRSDRRGHTPLPREAALGRDALPVPWPQGRLVTFDYP